MKKLAIIITCLFAFQSAIAQKIGVVDTEYILQKMPSFKDAEARLNGQIEAWQNEVSQKQTELQKKKDALESERVLLVEQQIKDREKIIADDEETLEKLLKTRFGVMGELNTLRANLSKPFQDQIWNAIKILSEKNTLGIVLDKSDNKVLFLDKKFDYTEKVIDILKINDKKSTPEKTNSKELDIKEKREKLMMEKEKKPINAGQAVKM